MSMPGTPKTPTGAKHLGQLQDIFPQIAMNPVAFNELIKAHGAKMIHARPVPCPNIRDMYGSDHDPNCEMCSNGFVYYAQKEFVGVIMGNSLSRQFQMNGTYDYDSSTVIIPTKYSDGTELDVQIFDRIFLPGHPPVRYYQRVEHSQTGTDRLEFPAVSVDFVMDSRGNRYTPGVDLEIDQNGNVHWLGKNRPNYHLDIDKGEIYSINYYLRPTLTIISLPHQLRVTQTISEGVSIQERFPQLASVKKDFIPYRPNDVFGPSDSGEPRDGQI